VHHVAASSEALRLGFEILYAGKYLRIFSSVFYYLRGILAPLLTIETGEKGIACLVYTGEMGTYTFAATTLDLWPSSRE